MADKPVIVRLASGAEYGLASEDVAKRVYPGAVIVGYQDGTPLESADDAKPVSKMNREELEARAIELNITNPDDKELYPNVASLREAIANAEVAE